MSKATLWTLGLALALAGPARAQNAGTVLEEAAKAIGANDVKTLQYSGPASEYNFGQAYTKDRKSTRLNSSH